MVAQEQNAGYAAGIAKRSAVKQIGWALKGAPERKKDLKLNTVGAIAEGRKLRDRITENMKKRGANPEDAVVYLVVAEPDLSGVVGAANLPVSPASDYKVAGTNSDKLPIGFLVFVIDRYDAQQPIFGHIRPLIVEDSRGPLLLAAVLAKKNYELKTKLIKAGIIPDDRN